MLELTIPVEVEADASSAVFPGWSLSGVSSTGVAVVDASVPALLSTAGAVVSACSGAATSAGASVVAASAIALHKLSVLHSERKQKAALFLPFVRLQVFVCHTGKKGLNSNTIRHGPQRAKFPPTTLSEERGVC